MTIKEKYYLKKFATASESYSNPLANAANGALNGGFLGGLGAGTYLPWAGYRKIDAISRALDKADISAWYDAAKSSPKFWKVLKDSDALNAAKGWKKIPAAKDLYKSIARLGTKNPKALFLKSLLSGAGIGSLLGLAASD